MITLIDNYDSFTYNLVHYLGDLGAAVEVYRNDRVSVPEILDALPEAIVLSPGPCDPDKAGICLKLVEAAAGKIPVLGVCLGHQVIGQAFGGRIIRSPVLMHGKLSPVLHDGAGLFEGLPSPVTLTRYHSLAVEPVSMPDCLEVTAQTQDGTIMALQHKKFPVYGVQFHPESIASTGGHEILANFLRIAGLDGAKRTQEPERV